MCYMIKFDNDIFVKKTSDKTPEIIIQKSIYYQMI